MFNHLPTGRYWDRPWFLVQGCTPVSPGCLHCWSAAEAHMRQFQRNPKIRDQYQGLTHKVSGIPTFNGTVRLRPDRLALPLRTRKPTVWAIWTDLGHESVPDWFRCQALEVMCSEPAEKHIFLILTKRPENFEDFFECLELPGDSPLGCCLEVSGKLPPNIWFITTAENQAMADLRIPELLKIPAAVRGVSLEPMLGPVDLTPWLPPFDDCDHYEGGCTRPENPFAETGNPLSRPGLQSCRSSYCVFGRKGVNWILCGGETGPRARPMHPDWPRQARDQCQAAGVPFFFKQWGEWAPVLLNYSSHKEHWFDDGKLMIKVGKKAAGRRLDGRTWDEVPEIK